MTMCTHAIDLTDYCVDCNDAVAEMSITVDVSIGVPENVRLVNRRWGMTESGTPRDTAAPPAGTPLTREELECELARFQAIAARRAQQLVQLQRDFHLERSRVGDAATARDRERDRAAALELELAAATKESSRLRAVLRDAKEAFNGGASRDEDFAAELSVSMTKLFRDRERLTNDLASARSSERACFEVVAEARAALGLPGPGGPGLTEMCRRVATDLEQERGKRAAAEHAVADLKATNERIEKQANDLYNRCRLLERQLAEARAGGRPDAETAKACGEARP